MVLSSININEDAAEDDREYEMLLELQTTLLKNK